MGDLVYNIRCICKLTLMKAVTNMLIEVHYNNFDIFLLLKSLSDILPPEVNEAVPSHGATFNSVWSSLFAEALKTR